MTAAPVPAIAAFMVAVFVGSMLAGLVVQTGGKLSHGAILAREYGIPAVGGITGATTLIDDRIEVEVDGLAGWVIVDPVQS